MKFEEKDIFLNKDVVNGNIHLSKEGVYKIPILSDSIVIDPKTNKFRIYKTGDDGIMFRGEILIPIVELQKIMPMKLM